MVYYVDFRARTAASYGHAFVWYGRSDQKQIEVAGLHPASDSVIPYIIGHVLPVVSETGKSYGDLDEQYLTASYRVYMSEAKRKRVFAYIKHLQATSPVWNAATWNCVAFIQSIAREMGLRVPGNHLLYPEDWVNQLARAQRRTALMPAQPVAQGLFGPSSSRSCRPEASGDGAEARAPTPCADGGGQPADLTRHIVQRQYGDGLRRLRASAFVLWAIDREVVNVVAPELG